MTSFLKLVHRTNHDKNLDRRYSVEHVCIMTRGSSKSPIVLLTRKHKVNGFLPGQCIRMTQEVQGSQTPIDPIEPQMLG